jgi:hypothetical protein
MQVGDQLTLELNGLVTAVQISEVTTIATTYHRPYWVKAVDPNLNFRNTLFYAACKMSGKEATSPYDTWATSTGNPVWSAGPSDAVINLWYIPTTSDSWWNYSNMFSLRLWNSGTPTKTGEGGSAEYRYTWSSPFRVHTLSSLDRSNIHIFDVIGGAAGSGTGLAYIVAATRGNPCKGVPAVAYIKTSGLGFGGAAAYAQRMMIDERNSVTAEAIAYNPFLMTGAFGADRNHDGVFSIGSIRKSDRLRAELIARFNYYDPIAWICLGQ